MKQTLFILLALIIYGCNNNEGAFFPHKPIISKEISIDTLFVEKIILDSVPSSFVGESGILNDKQLYFIDRYYCNLLTFDTTGKFVEKKLGQGRAANETTIGRIATSSIFPDGSLFMLGYNLDHYLYNKDIRLEKQFTIMPFKNQDSSQNIEENPFTYTHLYNDIICRNYKNDIYINMRAEHPKFNFIASPNKFFSKSYTIFEVDIKNEKFDRLLAKGYPPNYAKDPTRNRILSGVIFDIDNNGNFYVNYETDSLIYVYDHKFNPIECYGFSGNNMDIDYTKITDFAQSRKNYRKERNTKGYYNWIEFDDNTNTLFRTYKKGSISPCDGLQIYQDGVLKADLNVPKNMRVAGYIHPYYYSYILSDEDDCTMIAYRFKL